jgi:hypothetical protein
LRDHISFVCFTFSDPNDRTPLLPQNDSTSSASQKIWARSVSIFQLLALMFLIFYVCAGREWMTEDPDSAVRDELRRQWDKEIRGHQKIRQAWAIEVEQHDTIRVGWEAEHMELIRQWDKEIQGHQKIRQAWAIEVKQHDTIRIGWEAERMELIRQWDIEVEQHNTIRAGWEAERNELIAMRKQLVRDKEDWKDEKRGEARRKKEEQDRIRAKFYWEDLGADQHCLRYSTRQYTARVANVPRQYDPVQACKETAIEINGVKILNPVQCEDRVPYIPGYSSLCADISF